MKILFFIHGSIQDRIVAWDIKGYKPVFAHDVILWGPIPDSRYTFEGKEVPIISLPEPTSIKTVFDKLPDGWMPDIVTCDTSVLNYIPDIFLCPVKTILFTRDAWADTIFNRDLVELFDFMCHSVVDMSAYSNFQVNLLPMAGFPVSLPDPGLEIPDFEERDLDVIAIANYNTGFYHERYKTFYRLSEANNSGLKIKFYKGLKRSEIHNYYRRSKIVIDWAHTLSNRSYEAALNGCLLFSQEDNPATKALWQPGLEYITYNDDNLYEQIAYYIRNPGYSKEIIDRAYKKIKTLPLGFGHYTLNNIFLALGSTIDIKERIARINRLNHSDLLYRTATPLVYNYRYNTNFPPNWKEEYFDRIEKALFRSPDIDSKIKPLIEAARLAFLLKKYDLSSRYLNDINELLPEYAWVYYLQGRILFEENKWEKALDRVKIAIKHGLENPELLQKYVMPLTEKGLSCDDRRITDYLWQSVHNHKNEYQIKAFLFLSYDLIGDIYYRINDTNQAIRSYIEAIECIPISECIIKVSPLLIKNSQYVELQRITEMSINDSPYESIVILYYVYANLVSNNKQTSVLLLKRHRAALKSFSGIRKMLFIRQSIYFILLFLIFSKKASISIIRFTINALNRENNKMN